MADRVTELQRELLAICRGGYAYETWARVTEQPINERTDYRGRLRGQARVDEIRCELHAINPNAALYFGWGPSERTNAKDDFYARVLQPTAGVAAGEPARDALRGLVAALREYGTFPPKVLPALQAAEAALGVKGNGGDDGI